MGPMSPPWDDGDPHARPPSVMVPWAWARPGIMDAFVWTRILMAPGHPADLRCLSCTRTRPAPARLSAAEPPRILGVPASTVAKWVSGRLLPKAVKWQRYGLDRADVENLAMQRYTLGHPGFATNREAAQNLGI